MKENSNMKNTQIPSEVKAELWNAKKGYWKIYLRNRLLFSFLFVLFWFICISPGWVIITWTGEGKLGFYLSALVCGLIFWGLYWLINNSQLNTIMESYREEEKGLKRQATKEWMPDLKVFMTHDD